VKAILESVVTESREKALRLKKGMKWATLVYDSMYVTNYHPLKNFLSGRSSEIFKDDMEVKYLYNNYYYFCCAGTKKNF